MVNISSNLRSCWEIWSWSISISLLVKNKTWFRFCYLIHSLITGTHSFVTAKKNPKCDPLYLTWHDPNSGIIPIWAAHRSHHDPPGEGAPHEVAVAGADPGPGLVMPRRLPTPSLRRAVSAARTRKKYNNTPYIFFAEANNDSINNAKLVKVRTQPSSQKEWHMY